MRCSSKNQDEIPRFVGLIALLYIQKRLPTSRTYLPPIQNPTTEVNKWQQFLKYDRIFPI